MQREIEYIKDIECIESTIYKMIVKFKNDYKEYPLSVDFADPQDLQYIVDFIKKPKKLSEN